MSERTVVIIVGVSGSGKSTYVERMLHVAQWADADRNCSVVSADDFFMMEGEYIFDPLKLPEAHSNCLRQFLIRLRMGDDLVIVDNTNLRPWERQNYIAAAELAGYKWEAHVIKCETMAQIKICADRCRHGLTAHQIAGQALSMDLSSLEPFIVTVES